ncbi:RHS repeat-associated core domain [Pseudomonas asplenii]|uniref:RHS repeat-associated core domain n=1 Tax=Pseudomonas asplenii TaxID=53407 RepID=A0A0N0E404_9PSED|nr:RHS repeat-associated core domain-containing protein [Pseudomonas fuscovaginae]KPA90693.1 RHS repeat-associated core domain [Pseudomonas fuscovaginae]
MATPRTLLSQYRYDPLDRLVACRPVNLDPQQRFYCKSRLATEIQGAIVHSFFQSDNGLLAQQRRQGAGRETVLLATDQQGSVLQALDGRQRQAIAYNPYGHWTPSNGLLSLRGFNGERPDPVTGHYLLGNGYRAFNPVLMRFNSPDSLSPFGAGKYNGYAYCEADPVGNIDPTGHFANPFAVISLVSGLAATGSAIAAGLTKDETQVALSVASALMGIVSISSGLFGINARASRVQRDWRARNNREATTLPLLSSADLPPEYIQTTKLASIQRSDKLARKFGMVLSSTPPEPPPPTYEQAMQLRRGK